MFYVRDYRPSEERGNRMTDEEAIAIIGNIPVYGDECYSIAEYQEAKTMAIKALSVPKKIKAEIEKMPTDYCGGYIGLDKKEVLQIIDNIGKAESEGDKE